jgi:predicted GIY-YIG superfamily endonuclease
MGYWLGNQICQKLLRRFMQQRLNRLKTHNAGGASHTAKYKPWELVTCLRFSNKLSALKFEKYLKTQSGRAFAKKRLW